MYLITGGLQGVSGLNFVCPGRQCVIADTLKNGAGVGRKAGFQEPPETPGAQPFESKDENERVVTLPLDYKLLSKCDTSERVSGTEKFRFQRR